MAYLNCKSSYCHEQLDVSLKSRLKILLCKKCYLIFWPRMDGEEETDSEDEGRCGFEIGESTWSTLCCEEARYEPLMSAE